MKTSEQIDQIAPALVNAQASIKFAEKNAVNPHFRNQYADLPAVIDAAKPALNKNGIMFIQTLTQSDPGTLALTTRLLHTSGQWIEDTLTMPLPKSDPQGYGSAVTYGRRYALSAIVGLYADDDDGEAASAQQKGPVISASRLAFDEMQPEVQQQARMAAQQIAKAMPDVKQAMEIIDMFVDSYPDDETVKAGLWHLLESKTRSAIKAYKETE